MKTIYLSGVVGYEITAESIKEKIKENSKEKLRVVVNSPGGYVTDAFEIYNLFSSYTGEVEFIIQLAASAMSYIIMAGDKISAFKNSIFMAHKAQSIAFGDSDDMMREAKITMAMDNILAESYVKRLGKSKEEILIEMKNEIWLIGWESLTDSGIIDNVIDSTDEIELIDEETKTKIINMNSELDEMNDEEKLQITNLRILQCKNRMIKDTDKIKTSSMKAAAMIEDFNPVNVPVKNKINSQEEKMTLQDFLKTNPDANAEYENALQTAEANGKAKAEIDGSEELIKAERVRIAQILEKADIELTSVIVEALETGMDVGTYALAELDRQKALRKDKGSSVFASLAIVPKQIPGEQDESGKDDFNEKLDKLNIGGKK